MSAGRRWRKNACGATASVPSTRYAAPVQAQTPVNQIFAQLPVKLGKAFTCGLAQRGRQSTILGKTVAEYPDLLTLEAGLGQGHALSATGADGHRSLGSRLRPLDDLERLVGRARPGAGE